ncbi:MAG: recombinase family protein [Tepidisphaeraceae bacterium]|jgi:DNA invertase Pin-like site-specific DNA recombinase
MKRFVALARVSSREQEREGFSLAVQEDALRRYATSAGGDILKFFRIAETASKTDERKTFKELVAFAKQHAAEIDGLLFYKVDRAARNLYDYVELERLESEHGVPFISVSQPTDSNPAGRMMRRTLANMASFYTEQQSVDVREGHARRVQEGWFVNRPPYGYRNIRVDGRGIIEIDPNPAANVRLMFQLFAYEPLTLDGLVSRLHAEGLVFRGGMPKFPRSSVYTILQDRAYIGEIHYQGQWYPGKHEPLVDRTTWDRVQVLLGGKSYRSHELTYAGSLVRCAHCGNLVTGEQVTKKSSGKLYVYYRCTMYNKNDHPRTRVTEQQLDEQVLAVFKSIQQPEQVRDWFSQALREWSKGERGQSQVQTQNLQRELTQLRQQQDRLLNLRLLEEISTDTFAAKGTELRDRIANLTLQLEAADRDRGEQAEIAIKSFELSQSLVEKWLVADYAAKRQLLEIVFLNFKLDDVTLCYEMRKPFDVLAKGLLVSSHRGDRI